MRIFQNLIKKTTIALFIGAAATAQAASYEVVTKLPTDVPPGNIAISKEGRMFLSVHDFYPSRLRLVELFKDGSSKPFPSEEWAVAPVAENAPGLQSVLGLNTDGQGTLWVLDNAGEAHAGRLVAFDLAENKVKQVIYLANHVVRDSSFLNDIAIDTKHNAIYISDTGSGDSAALIVVDLNTGIAKRVLEGSQYTIAENIDMVIEDKVLTQGGQSIRFGVNPITIDNDFEWVYFAPMTGHSMYRVPTSALLDNSLNNEQIAKTVEKYGQKPISDGSMIDSDNNVYVTGIADGSIGVVQANGEYKTLLKDEKLAWPDGFAAGADGYIYATINELHRSPVLNNGKNDAKGEFKIIRFKPLADVKVGR